ncbi:MAG: KpsF/GutQ family sugar-phosphate isomerase [Parvularculaceae bacterium]
MSGRDENGVDYLAVAREVLDIEAAALGRMAQGLGGEFTRAVEMILGTQGRVICVGIGKSGHVARKIAATLSSTGTAAYFVHPAEASHGDLGMIQTNDIVLALSRSGETAEMDDLIQYTRRFKVGLIAMTVNRDSTLGRAADILLQLPDAPEACAETQAPTTSTTLSMALGDALAVALLRGRGFDAGQFKIFHPGGKLGAMLKTAGDVMRAGADMPTARAGASLSDALKELSAKGLGCVMIVDANGKLAGIVTDGDLRRVVASGRMPESVDAAMTANPVTALRQTLAGAVLQMMNEKKITQMPVVENGRLIGVVHMHDILKAGLV